MRIQALPSVRPALPVAPPATPVRPPAAPPTLMAPDQLFLSRRPAAEPDYEKMFAWVERVTGEPIAYRTPAQRQAYIRSIQGRPQSYFDPQGLLASWGMPNAKTYGRDARGIHQLLQQVPDYKPDNRDVSKTLQVLQQFFFKVWKKSPGAFNAVANIVDPLILTRKDRQEKPWQKVSIPQPPLANIPLVAPALIWQRYGASDVAQALRQGRPLPQASAILDKELAQPEVSFMFGQDFHSGLPQPGKPEPRYGTWAIARSLGFAPDQAARIAKSVFDIDLNTTPYGLTGSFPKENVSRHFDLHGHDPKLEDTRFIWAQRHLDAAIALAKRGRFDQAELELGYGLHGIQDAFAHGHLRPAEHSTLGHFPDSVKYNPVAMAEASIATAGYLNTYLKAVLG